MGNEWDIEIWTSDPNLTGHNNGEYYFVEVRRGDGLQDLLKALAEVREMKRSVRVTYRGWFELIEEDE